MKKDNISKDVFLQKKKDIGLDKEEQEMNGLYGMAETAEEDEVHDSNNSYSS
ncbi:DUF4021 domain-containing protein [Niallia sp. 03133]|uniref:DUF4021 domain-containing protein n=1 Tax=Niallia sp. 03133 TaxID=3458060 RepID=UPI004044412A